MSTDNFDIGKFNDGDKGAWEIWVTKNFEQFVFRANAWIRDPIEAEDIVQDKLTAVFKSKRVFEDEQHLNNFTRKAIRHECYTRVKKKKERGANEAIETLEEPVDPTDEDAVLSRIETLKMLREGIDLLPPECRKIIDLYLAGRKPPEIAEKLTIAKSTVYTQINKAITTIKAYFRRRGLLLFFLLLFI